MLLCSMWRNYMKLCARFTRSFSIFINTIVRQHFIHEAALLLLLIHWARASERRKSISKYYLKMCLFIRCNTSLCTVADSSNAAHCIICERLFCISDHVQSSMNDFSSALFAKACYLWNTKCVHQIIFHHSTYPTPTPLRFFQTLSSHTHVFK